MPPADPGHNIALPMPRIGSYQLIQALGSGGMSSVFRAIHVETGHVVALKVLPRTLAKKPTLLQRFLREAKSAEALEHPNIVAIYDRGSDQGRYYLALEFLPGGDLHDRVKEKGPLAVDEVVTTLRSVAHGLRYAASRGLIHRDIKPANLLLDADGQVKITDLGLALHLEEEDERVTRDGTTVGTVDYMAPEQGRDSRATSIRSDIYSLGCTCYYLLTGSPPFPGGDVVDKLRRHVTEPPPDVRARRPEVAPALAKLIQTMMAKRPDDRFADYDALLDALDRLPPALANGELLDALIDDEEGHTGDFGLGLAAIDAETARAPTIVAPLVESADLGLVALEALDGRPSRPAPEPRPAATAASTLEPRFVPTPTDELAEPVDIGTRGGDVPLGAYMVRGLILGVVFVLVGFGVWQLAWLSTSPPSEPEPAVEAEVAPPSEPMVVVPQPALAPMVATQARVPTGPAEERPWVEPEETVRVFPPEVSYPPEVRARLMPGWARARLPEKIDGPFVRVRRVAAARGDVPDLARAFQQIGGTVELADVGPFFEEDLRITGPDRLVRAANGNRTVVALGPPTNEYYQGLPAVFVLEGQRVILDGIDLVLRSDDFRQQTALFLLKGSDLTLTNCTVTVVGSRPMTFVQVGEAAGGGGQPSRLRLDRTLVRGSHLTGLHLTSDPADVAVDGSVWLCGGEGVVVTGRGLGPRRVAWSRSIVATRAAAIDLSAPGGTVTATGIGSTFAHIGTNDQSRLIAVRDGSAAPREAIDWRGFDNLYVGWDAWLSAVGAGRTVKLPDLAAARTAWPGGDGNSREQPGAWPESPGLDEASPSSLTSLAPERAATLARVASPSPYLWEKTLGAFRRQPVPEIPVATVQPGLGEVVFATDAEPWKGDLGAFLQAQAPDDERRIRVRVRGTGDHLMTPVRLPDGVSLEVNVERVGGVAPPSWSPRPGTGGGGLIEARGGDLVLTGVRLWRRDGGGPRHLVRVEDGSLRMADCWLTAPLTARAEALIGFRAASTRPLPPRGGPPGHDRPVCGLSACLLTNGGAAVLAELARGVVALDGCAIASGEHALLLRPQEVRRDRFEADLWVDRTTIVARRSAVWLGAWPGRGTGPDRPWLVSSKDSAFLDDGDRSGSTSAVLWDESGALAGGGLFWQGAGDAFNVSRFTVSGVQPPPSFPSTGLDARRQWVGLWGRSHVTTFAPGPGRNGAGPGARLAVERLVPAEFTPGDLALDPTFPPGRPATAVGADLRRLGIVPTARARGERRRSGG